MIQALLVLLLSLSFVQSLDTSPSVCPVVMLGQACVTQRDAGSCHSLCRDASSGVVDGECMASPVGGNRLCFCQAECVTASLWGDPHITTFDKAVLDYHGPCTHVLTKPIRRLKFSPFFEVWAKSHPMKNSPSRLTVPDQVQVIIRSWALNVTIGKTAQINNQEVSVPFHWQRNPGEFILITELKDGFQVITNFGLAVQTKGLHTGIANSAYVHIGLPKALEFDGKLVGLLGNMDGHTYNDYTTSYGKILPGSNIDFWEIGDSFCLNKSEKTGQKMAKEYERQHLIRMGDCAKDPKKSQHQKRCSTLTMNEDLAECRGHDELGRLVEDCKIDMCYSKVFCEIMNVANHPCMVSTSCY